MMGTKDNVLGQTEQAATTSEQKALTMKFMRGGEKSGSKREEITSRVLTRKQIGTP